MPSAMTSAVDLSAVALAKLHSRLPRRRQWQRIGRERARLSPERPGDCPVRDMGRGPEVKARLSDSRRKSPLLRVTADTPCRLSKSARSEVLSRSCRLALEDGRVFVRT
jgi:hypothetical protein